jgi:hypothetical protein
MWFDFMLERLGKQHFMVTTPEPRVGPPYISFRTFLNFLDWMEQDGLPQAFDRSVLGQRLSGTYSAQVLNSLIYLGLIDSDRCPTDKLEHLVFDRGQRKSILREILRDRYPFKIDYQRATPSQLRDEFMRLGLSGDTLRKALAFFTNAALYADIPLSSYVARRLKGRTKSRRVDSPAESPIEPSPRISQDEATDFNRVLTAMLGELTEKGPRWNLQERDRWLATFTAAVDMLFPPKPD